MNKPDTLSHYYPELVEALKAIVELDDGDEPGLWPFQSEFDAARALLSRLPERDKGAG